MVTRAQRFAELIVAGALPSRMVSIEPKTAK
jgi:hypothetical protein